MPVSTARFRFEYRVFDWAESHVRALGGHRVGFLIALREDGTLRRVYYAAPDKPWDGEQKTSMALAHPRWFLYVPQEAPGRGYLEWDQLPVSVVRRWLGRPVLQIDLQDVRGGEALEHWPESWRVVVG